MVNITKQFETTSINESNKIREHCNNMKRNILENLGLWGTEIKLRLEDDGSEIKMVTKSISEQVKLQNVSFVDQIKKIETMMEEYQVKLIQVEDFEKSIKALEIENSSLQQQVTENMSLIGMKEAQFEEKSLALANVTIELSKIKSGNDELAQSLKEKQERFEIVEKELQISQDLLDSERANFENKLVSQNEINSAMSTENEILKSRIKELENYKETWERDQDGRIDKLQKINEQFQKLNVESVQLKAHELELEEENRNLRRAIELNEESVQDNSRELSLLRQQMIGFTAERQEMTADKLKQQDKNEELQEIIKQLRKEVSRLKTSIEKYKESERKEKQKPALPTHQNQNNKQIKETPKPKLKSRERGDSIILQTQSTQEKPVSKTNKSAKEMVRITTSTKENPNKGVKEQRKEVNTANDDFDLSGSSNDDFDDLELTNSSPIFLKPIASKVRTNGKRDTRKKLLLYDESEDGAHASKGGNLNKRRKR